MIYVFCVFELVNIFKFFVLIIFRRSFFVMGWYFKDSKILGWFFLEMVSFFLYMIVFEVVFGIYDLGGCKLIYVGIILEFKFIDWSCSVFLFNKCLEFIVFCLYKWNFSDIFLILFLGNKYIVMGLLKFFGFVWKFCCFFGNSMMFIFNKEVFFWWYGGNFIFVIVIDSLVVCMVKLSMIWSWLILCIVWFIF